MLLLQKLAQGQRLDREVFLWYFNLLVLLLFRCLFALEHLLWSGQAVDQILLRCCFRTHAWWVHHNLRLRLDDKTWFCLTGLTPLFLLNLEIYFTTTLGVDDSDSIFIDSHLTEFLEHLRI